MNHRLAAACLALAALIASPVLARDLYVDNSVGSNLYDGFCPKPEPGGAGPVETIARALQLAIAGDRIVLAKTDAPYRESITLFGNRHSGSVARPFILEGNGATLDGSRPVPTVAWKHYEGQVFRFAPSEAGHQQLFLDGRPAERVKVTADQGSLPSLSAKQWCYLAGHIYFCVEPKKIPADYDLSYAHLTTGITLYFVRDVALVNLTVQGFRVDGINVANTARGVYLGGIVARGNGRSGVTVDGASQVELERDLAGSNGASQLLTLPWSHTVIRESALLGDTAPGWVDRGGRVVLGTDLITGGRDEIKPE